MIELTLRTDERGDVSAYLGDERLAGPTPRDTLPKAPALYADPYALGRSLYAALGGPALLARLEGDAGGLLIDADDAAQAVPWEFATLPGSEYLACRFGLLRLVDRPAPPPTPGPLRLIVLGADPLVDDNGRAREGYRLKLDEEFAALRAGLNASGKALEARRLPPTAEALRAALRTLPPDGAALLHLSCHGTVVNTDSGPSAMLLLEDANGAEQRLRGADLTNMAPRRGGLRLVVLSACKTDEGQAGLARALVAAGAPAALGMSGSFPDDLSDHLAVALYETLLAGHDLGEAARQARRQLAGRDTGAAGLPVVYVARGGWAPLAAGDGVPAAVGLGWPGRRVLPVEVRAPADLLGRNGDLHDLARLYSGGARVVTITGTGGIGKTALAAAFAGRFAWRWPAGVVAASFAAGELDVARFRDALLEGMLGRAAAEPLRAEPAARQEAALLDAAAGWPGLLLIDNYETVQQALEAGQDGQAEAIHRLVAGLARGGATLLLTSRQQPAGLSGERLYPGPHDALPGLAESPAVALFFTHSTIAGANHESRRRYRALAGDIAAATAGHPLAVTLLAGEFDGSDVAPERFLSGWAEALAAARNAGLAAHHATFRVAFERSYRALPPERQARLRRLSVFPFPFFAEGAAAVWGLAGEGDAPDGDAARPDLGRLARASLLEVDGWFTDSDQPATWRFQPALRQAAAREAGPDDAAAMAAGFAAYGGWLARRGYGDIHRDPALARLVRLSLPALDATTAALEGVARLWHIRRVAWLKAAYGETAAAFELLDGLVPPALPDATTDRDLAAADSALRFQLAGLCVTRGDLDRALALYQDSLKLKEQVGDIQGKAASLHQMAQVYLTRGDLDRALALYQDSLKLKEQVGDIKGKAASLHAMAQVYLTRGDLDRALALYQDSLKLLEQVGDIQGKATSLAMVAQIYATQGDRQTALALLEESLAVFARLGMPRETAQVRELIAALAGGPAGPPTPLAEASGRARRAAQSGDLPAAIAAQQEAVALARGAGSERDDLVRLSVLLFNLGGYYSEAGDYAAAVAALQEVVALDERTGYPDLESDRATLEQARQMAALSPEERAALAAAAKQAAEQLAAMSEDERAGVMAAAQRAQIEQLATQARDATLAALRGETDRAGLAAQLEHVAGQAADGEAPGSPWLDVAGFIRAAAALLRGEPLPPVPAAYAGQFAALQDAAGGSS